MMKRIKLRLQEWEYDPNRPLGAAGGFGEVFSGVGEGYGEVAVKRLKVTATEAAHRELRLAEELTERKFTHVIPVFDSGQDAESDAYFVVMARAEKSLQDEVKDDRIWGHRDAAEVLLQIVKGLEELADIVHRDLKPANVLFHEGVWKIADFGIARFVEESTSMQTLKSCWTPPFAAPEQWLFERASAASDLYAIGCIAYVLLTGCPPFLGPDFRRQHLSAEPSPLNGCNPLMASLVSMLLRKAPQSRPSRTRVIAILERIRDARDFEPPVDGLAALERVNSVVAREYAARESQVEAVRLKAQQRTELMQQAQVILKSAIASRLAKRICDNAPAACQTVSQMARTWVQTVTLGRASLRVVLESDTVLPENAFERSGWDIVTGGTIVLNQNPITGTCTVSRSASLWYGNTGMFDGYRWFEVGYFTLSRNVSNDGDPPFALSHHRADQAAGRALGVYQLAYTPRQIDDENEEDFLKRWITLFVKAAEGSLTRPRVLPITDSEWQ